MNVEKTPNQSSALRNLLQNNGSNPADLMAILQLPPDQLAELTTSMERNILNGVKLIDKKIVKEFLLLNQSFLLRFKPLFFDERSFPELTLIFIQNNYKNFRKFPHNCSLYLLPNSSFKNSSIFIQALFVLF